MRSWFLLACLAVACSGPSRAVALVARSGTVTGVVLDEAGAPVPDFEVRLLSGQREKEVVGSARTGADGAFSFAEVRAGRYALGGRTGDRYLVGGGIQIPGTGGPFALRAQLGATVRIHVLDDQGAPVGGAHDWRFDEVSDADGLLELRGLSPQDSTVIWVSANGFLAAKVDGEVEATVRLERGTEIRGTVQGPDGMPIAGAPVSTLGCIADASKSDDDGRWTLYASPGRCWITASAPGLLSGSVTDVVVDGSHPVDGVSITLARGATVSGTVVDERGTPVPFARVVDRALYWPSTTADEHGAFTLSGLTAQPHSIAAVAGDLSASEIAIDLTTGDRSDVRFVLARSILEGVVVDARGDRLPGVHVTARHPWTFDTGYAITDSKGRFYLGGLRDGRYEVTATFPGTSFEEARRWPKISMNTNGAAVKLTIPDPGSITGKVVLDGKPVEAYAIALSNYSSSNLRIIRSGDGVFVRGSVAPGTWPVAVFGEGFATTVIESVVVKPGEQTDLGTIELSHGAEIRGRVVDTTGAAVAGAEVMLSFRPDPDRLWFSRWDVTGDRLVTSDANGAFVIRGVTLDADKRLGAAHPSFGRSAAMLVPDVGQEAVLTLRPVGTIEGVITALPSGEIPASVEATFGATHSLALPDASGRYRIDNLPPGPYTMVVDAHFVTTDLGTVEVRPGATAELSYAFGAQVDVDVQVGKGTCTQVTLTRTGIFARGWCTKGASEVTIGFVTAGSYQLCIDSKCAAVTIPAEPRWQLLELAP